jgi:hypothetical protein
MKRFSFPNLRCPPVPLKEPTAVDLVDWGIRLYCFSWMRHFSTLVNGLVSLEEAGNDPSARIIARSVFELGAHAYYVKKHIKQHIDAANLAAAWKFLTPIAVGSRYISEQHPEESDMFPSPPHISKAINCFAERMPEDAQEGYSFLSEFCHPNLMAFLQYYNWADPQTVMFVDSKPANGIFGSTAAASMEALLAIEELLRIAHELEVRLSLRKMLEAIVEAGKADAASA